MTVGMPSLAFGGGPENRCNIIVTFDISLCRKIQVSAVRLGLSSEGVLEVLFSF
jgi:hypothetical protein